MTNALHHALKGIRRYLRLEGRDEAPLERDEQGGGEAVGARREVQDASPSLPSTERRTGFDLEGSEPNGARPVLMGENEEAEARDIIIRGLIARTSPLEGMGVREAILARERDRRKARTGFFRKSDPDLEKIPRLVMRIGPEAELDADERELQALIGGLVPTGYATPDHHESLIRGLIARTNPVDDLKGKEAPVAEEREARKGIWGFIRRRDPSLERIPTLVVGRGGPASATSATVEGGSAEVIGSYSVNPPFARVRIVKDAAGGVRYEAVEPLLEPREIVLLEEVFNYFRDTILFESPMAAERMTITMEELGDAVRMFEPAMKDTRLPVLYYYLTRNFYGYGRIDLLMRDPALEDISCNGPQIPVFVFHREYGSIPTNIVFGSEEMNRFVLRLAQKADKQISLSTPLVDAHLPDGSRIQLTFSDVVSTRGSSFTIRRFKKDPMTPLNLVQYGTFDPLMLAFIWYALEHRSSAIIAGGTASGKTSTMNAISFFIPPNAKIVSLEDTREIQLPHQNWLPVQTRELSLTSVKGEIDLFMLLKSSLRQRPEYIIVGEVRGKEAQTLFQAMNTGHTTLSTLHAGDIEEAINRLTNEPIAVPPVMFSALDLMIIQGIHHREGRIIRRCDSIHEIMVERDGTIQHQPLFLWDPKLDDFERLKIHSRILSRIAHDYGTSEDDTLVEIGRRARFIHELLQNPPATAEGLLLRLHDFLAAGGCAATDTSVPDAEKEEE
ncbi:MAG: type II/IV secretion system ATPase subunit [Methanomicrobiales archaeon]|nr:type II/IV secretion system ATPase subunit [Methanomicrobiales archaeon]